MRGAYVFEDCGEIGGHACARVAFGVSCGVGCLHGSDVLEDVVVAENLRLGLEDLWGLVSGCCKLRLGEGRLYLHCGG